MKPLPIDSVMTEIVAAVQRPGGAVVVNASPGAGKTTRVPRALLDGGLAGDGEIVVLQPRRLATRLAAMRVAEELGEAVGATVGYQVRFDRRTSDRTCIRFVTEGVLTRQLLSDPELKNVSIVVLDELHERHVHTDLALVLAERLRRTQRPDLRLVVMSATLDSGPVASLLGAPVIHCPTRLHDVAINYLPQPSREPLDVQVATTVRQLVRDGLSGHVLVFLPGMAEIQRAMTTCRAVAEQAGLKVLPLHGALPAREQDAAVAPSHRGKLILATNVAESSITIDGVTVVIDSGLARVAHHSPNSSLTALRLSPISQASATQRTGRAGRTGAGRCLRLYTEQDHRRQRPFDVPEIERSDLGEAALALRVAGVTNPSGLPWLTPPPADRLTRAETLLRRLGAIDEAGRATQLGRQMARLPVHPRLSRALVEAAVLGVAQEAASAVAIVAERGDLRRRRSGTHAPRRASLWDQTELLDLAEAGHFSAAVISELGLDGRAVQACQRATKQLRDVSRRLGRPAGDVGDVDRALGLALLKGFPDQVAKRTGATQPRPGAPISLAMADGGSALVHDPTVIGGEGFSLVLAAAHRDNRPALVRLAIPIAVDWLLDAFPDEIDDRTELCWNGQRERVEAIGELRYRGLVLEQTSAVARPSASAAKLLLAAAKRAGLHQAAKDGAVAQLATRAAFVAALGEPLPRLDEAALGQVLGELSEGMVSFAELKSVGIEQAALATLTHHHREQLRKLAPKQVRLASGRELPVTYPAHGEPLIESYLQDFFGMSNGPRIAAGAQPLVLHLWAPNRRAVQVTRDLAGFWERHYPDLSKALSRRYPKHHWPADPLTAPAKRLKREL